MWYYVHSLSNSHAHEKLHYNFIIGNKSCIQATWMKVRQFLCSLQTYCSQDCKYILHNYLKMFNNFDSTSQDTYPTDCR